MLPNPEHGHEGHVCSSSCDHHVTNLILNLDALTLPTLAVDEEIDGGNADQIINSAAIPAQEMATFLSDPMHDRNPRLEVVDGLQVSELRSPLQYHQKIGIEVGHPVLGYTWIDTTAGKKVFAVLYFADVKGNPYFLVSRKGYAADHTQALSDDVYNRLLRNAQNALGDYLLDQGQVNHTISVDQEGGAHLKLFGANGAAILGGVRQKQIEKPLTTASVKDMVAGMGQEITIFAATDKTVADSIHLGHNVGSNKGWQVVRRASGIAEARAKTGKFVSGKRLYLGDPLPLTQDIDHLYSLLPGVIFTGLDNAPLDIDLSGISHPSVQQVDVEIQPTAKNFDLLKSVVEVHYAQPIYVDNDEVKRQFAAVIAASERLGISFYAISARIAKAIETGETPAELLQSVLTDKTSSFTPTK